MIVTSATLLVTALLFGGMTLYSFGFAAFVFTALPAETAGPLIRKAFPHFYLFVIATSLAAAIGTGFLDVVSCVVMVLIAASATYARQVLMPMINAATDAGETKRFTVLHGASVVITLAHIIASAAVLIRLAVA